MKLNQANLTQTSYPTVALVILDGWGIAPPWGGNAISQATAPTVNWLAKQPKATLSASGPSVGLAAFEAGNSEVGHLNLGAGRVVIQDSTRITNAIADGSFFNNSILKNLANQLRQTRGRLHLVGLLSRASVHSQKTHLSALLRFCRSARISDLRLHIITDGRDSDPRDGLGQLLNLEQELSDVAGAHIQTVMGRYYAMDRDHHWERTKLAYLAIAFGQGDVVSNARLAISQSYSQNVTDEFIPPKVIRNQTTYSGLANHDVVLFWNFRPDRMRQLVRPFVDQSFTEFDRGMLPSQLQVLTLTNYNAEETLPGITPVFQPEPIQKTLSEVVSLTGAHQFHVAETEKYAHVTYFFNGGREAPFLGEERLLIPSLRIPTYDASPGMQAEKISTAIIDRLSKSDDRLIVANFANADMVGHTGNFQATLLAIEKVDRELGRLVQAVKKAKAVLVVTADHGNAEEMVNPQTGEPDTGHTCNPVPFYIVADPPVTLARHVGILADVAPTILDLLGIEKPQEMIGHSLLKP